MSAEKLAKANGGKKKLIIISVTVMIFLSLLAVGAFFYILQQRAAADEDMTEEDSPKISNVSKVAPAYLPLDNIVVNLSDPGGVKIAQIGLSLVLADVHAADTIKAFLPTIRNEMIMIVSSRTSADMLSAKGKADLSAELLDASLRAFGLAEDLQKPDKSDKADASVEDRAQVAAVREKSREVKKPKKKGEKLPVTGVLFTSFIVQ